jgi:UDP-glucose 4-epimerase
VETLVLALAELFGVKNPEIHNIGTRHGEKLYESLLGVEERVSAQDQGGYFRVPLDARDLNYSVYFEEGQAQSNELEAYHSHNTERLDIEGVKAKLLTLPEIRQELGL